MKLLTIWKRAGDSIWCEGAWDEFTIDENPQGWAEALAAAGPDARVLEVRFPYESVERLWATPSVAGVVPK